MRDGSIHRTATPQQLRDDPRDAWTADFLGLGTIWHPAGGVPHTGGPGISTPWGRVTLTASAPTEPPPRGGFCLLIRPEAVRPGGSSGVRARLSDVRVVGDRSVATFDVPGAPPLEAYIPADVTPGRDYRITLDPAGVTMLPDTA